MSRIMIVLVCLMFVILRATTATHNSFEDCPVGWVKFNSKCYLFSKQPATFTGAMTLCRMFKGMLAEPKTEDEVLFIEIKLQQLRDLSWDKFYFLGINDIENEDTWKYNSDGSPVSLFNWSKSYGEPNGGVGANCAVAATRANGKWGDFKCEDQYHFICEKPNM